MSEWSDWKLPDQVPITSLATAGEASAHTATITNSSNIWDKSFVASWHFSIFNLGCRRANFGLELLVPEAKFRRTKGATKLHLLLDHDGYLPRFAVITDGKTHELKIARKLRWDPGTIVVFDRGYIIVRVQGFAH